MPTPPCGCFLPSDGRGTNVTVTWQSVAGVNYFLERGTNLAAHPCFTMRGHATSPAKLGTTSYTDTNAAGAPTRTSIAWALVTEAALCALNRRQQ